MSGEMAGEVLSNALNRHAGLRVVRRVICGSDALEAVLQVHVDVAIISAGTTEDVNGIAVVRELRRRAPDVRAIVFFDTPDKQGVVEAFRAGAKGVFCPSHSSFRHLCRCVTQVHAGQIWARSDELAEVMNAFARQSAVRIVNANGVPLLTRREQDVVRLLAEGYQNRDIARELHLSEHTVKNYLFRVFEKLGISSRVELVLYAVSSMRNEDRTPGTKGEAAPAAAVSHRNSSTLRDIALGSSGQVADFEQTESVGA